MSVVRIGNYSEKGSGKAIGRRLGGHILYKIEKELFLR